MGETTEPVELAMELGKVNFPRVWGKREKRIALIHGIGKLPPRMGETKSGIKADPISK